MVTDKDGNPLHQLSEEGCNEIYRRLQRAIVYETEHPFKSFLLKLIGRF